MPCGRPPWKERSSSSRMVMAMACITKKKKKKKRGKIGYIASKVHIFYFIAPKDTCSL
jgi:hypothetical protein